MKLETLRRYAMSLSEVEERPHFEYTSFRVRGKIFLTVPPDGAHAHVFVAPTVRQEALAAHPDFAEELMWGGKAVGLRIKLANGPVDAVKTLVRRAWMAKAPATLIAKGTAPRS